MFIREALEILPEVREGEMLFLVCSHFPLAEAKLRARARAESIIDPAIFVREEVKEWGRGKRGNITAYLSGETAVFERLFKELFPDETLEIEKMVR